MKPLALRPYQSIAVDFLVDHPRCNLWAGMGMGKTVSTLVALDLLRMQGELDGPTLILGPLRVARDVWTKEPTKWDQYKDISVSPVVGALWERQAALRRRADYYTINYEQLPWLAEYLGDNWPFQTVVADESTRLKGYRLQQGGERVTALAEYAHRHTRRWINLTGTPAPKGLEDLWGQQWFVDHGAALGRSYSGFMQRWFRPKWNGYGTEPMPHSDKEIHERMKATTLTLDPKDWFDLKEPIYTPVYVDLPPAATAAYKQLEKELFTKLMTGEEIEVFNAGSLTNKCLQFANGAVYVKAPEWAKVHDAKIEALESIAEETNGAPLLVAYEYQTDKARILDTFKKRATDISTPSGFKRFMAGDVQLGVAHPKSMGHGVDGLQEVCHHVVKFGHTWDSELDRQLLERVGPVRQLQAGKDRPVWLYDIIARDTVDEAVVDRLGSKVRVEDALRHYMKRSKA